MKEMTGANLSILQKYRLTIITLIAGIAFLIGLGGMTLLLNNIERTLVNTVTAKLPSTLTPPTTAATFAATELSKKHKSIPLFISGQRVSDACKSVTELELISLIEIERTANNNIIKNVYNKEVGYITRGQSPKYFDVKAVIECIDDSNNSVMALATGQITVSQTNGSFKLISGSKL